MGGSGPVPFRAGDWKCGNEVCGYHNFAKNVCCLRCGSSRAGAAMVADSGYPSPMDGGSNYGMGSGSMAGTPGPGPFASAGAPFGPSGGYGQHFGGPPSTYALPSGIGGGATPYPSLNTHFGPTPGSHSAGPFDSRAAEAAFQAAGNGPASAGPSMQDNRRMIPSHFCPLAWVASLLAVVMLAKTVPALLRTNRPLRQPPRLHYYRVTLLNCCNKCVRNGALWNRS
jgi:hypothetical protein